MPAAGCVTGHSDAPGAFWTQPPEALAARLGCDLGGLRQEEAARRLAVHGPNQDAPTRRKNIWRAVARRLLEPLSLMLLVAGLVSLATGDAGGGSIIVAILALSIGLDTVQEGQAARAAEELRRSVALTAEVRRDGAFRDIDVAAVVPGDILRVRAGDIIPADALILDSSAFTAGEAALTGEPYPVEKRAGRVMATTPGEASNALFRGAVAQTGEAVALAVGTGRNTLFGAAAAALAEQPGLSPFQRDLRGFGLVTARLALALVLLVLTARVIAGRPALDSLMFAVALAVGLTPELLPMITTVTLSRGALRMARRKVIVKRLAAIHDLGAMTVLCTDKTGTLTTAEIALARSLDPSGAAAPRAAALGAVVAALGGDRAALDVALARAAPDAARGWRLLARHAFDFNRRLGSVLAAGPEGTLLIAKGAPEAILALCTMQRVGVAVLPMRDAAAAAACVRALAEDGLRTIAVASRPWPDPARDIVAEDEAGMVFEGLCAFADPPKATAAGAVARLAAAGIRLKILSGDDPVVVRRLAGLVGLNAAESLSGADMAAISNEALAVQARSVDVYGRLTPDQKARIVRALQADGTVVGFLGDGINDAPALRAADIGLSVDCATGVAQAAADMILLAADLQVVADGVEEGRRTFANILKYLRMGASSNFGNMLSMAAAALALPFLPMLPTQILLNNLLYDLSEIGIPFDAVQAEAVAKPQIWDLRGLIRFAAIMGPLSSVFDLLTFGALLAVFGAPPAEFQTAWFLESMTTQILVIFIIRTRGRWWRDLPHAALAASSFLALGVALAIPFTPAGRWFGFLLPPPMVLGVIGAIVVAYLVAVELIKPLAVAPSRRPR